MNETQDEPNLSFESLESAARNEETFTVIMTDPDAPSRTDPKWSEFCHW